MGVVRTAFLIDEQGNGAVAGYKMQVIAKKDKFGIEDVKKTIISYLRELVI